ncbi:hypothetical protein IAC76_08860 [Spirochaetes bacterium]|uniref:DUF4340 domain-containing protein n=1 Tax=Candidatus Scatousia excrementipullorum TaxID=2840936 RepID=A0A9D9H1K0_9BACT|nr:hypothetical protein [Candidatus Scatousia excrementipullorum]
MKKILVSVFAALLFFGVLSANAFWWTKQEETIALVPTMKCPSQAQNRIWVGTFQLAWNELMDNFTKGPVKFEGYKSPLVKELNSQSFKAAYISPDSYYSKFGETSPELSAEIEQAIKEKFNETSDVLDAIDWTKDEGKYVAYAMLKKDFKFIKAFSKLESDKFGSNRTKVEYFGINKDSEADLDNTLSVLFYNAKNDFAVVIRTEGKDLVYLYRTDDDKTFDKYYSDMMIKKAQYEGSYEFSSKDELKVPNLDLYKEQEFNQLTHKRIKGTNIEIDKALETVQFKMNNEGVKLKSEAIIAMKTCALFPQENKPRKFYFDDTFVMFLQEYDQQVPYFAMRVNDVETLNKTAKK